MSICKMQKVAVIGLDTEKEKLMSRLSEFGAVELIDQSSKLEDEEWSAVTISDENVSHAQALDQKVARAQAALEIIENFDTRKSPLFKTRKSISRSQLNEASAARELVEEEINMFLDYGDKIHSYNEKINKAETDLMYIAPWMPYGLPMEVEGTKDCNIHKGVIPGDRDAGKIAAEFDKAFEEGVMKIIRTTKEMSYVAILSTKSMDEEIMEFIKENGFTEMNFKEFSGTPIEISEKLQAEIDICRQGIDLIGRTIADKASLKDDVEVYSDILSMEAEKAKNRSKLLKTSQTFFLEGWIPERLMEEAKAILEESGCYYVFKEPEEGDNVPVVLENSSVVTPFESVTEMYSLPAYGSFDPTKIFAGFYAVFFGMMLSDAAYGIVMSIACFIILKKYDLEGMAQKLIKLFFYCGISTTFWGAMFGGWFGDIATVVGKTFFNVDIVIKPLWFNPIDDPIKLLIFSLGLGVVHLFIGLGIKAYMQIREGQWFDALCDEGFWIITITGIILWLAGSMILPALTNVGLVMAAVGAAGLLLTGGRKNKGIGKITGGLANIYNITSYLSDILSYSRILALGLATGVIAQVVNTMGSIFGGGVIGAILLFIIFIVGHVLNIAINVLGAYVHTCRLQYVEFFGKFYEDGGEPFEPMGKNTKYIKVMNDK